MNKLLPKTPNMMKNEFLLEIGTEEIPAGYITPALLFMKDKMADMLQNLSLSYETIKTAATPRRLALCVTGLSTRQPDRREELLGPPRKAAFDNNNQPTKAAIGFAKSRGATLDDIRIASTDKGEYLMLVQEYKGEQTADILSRILPDFILSIPFPKSMHWSAYKESFARPMQWLLAIFEGEIINFSLTGLKASDSSRGHRFMAPQTCQIHDFDHYIETLRSKDVLVGIDERKTQVENEVKKAALPFGGTIIPDQDLLDTVTNLVEKPVGVAGAFDKKFLDLPKEVLITSMRVNQKYFTVEDNKGNLLPHFVAVNNTDIKNKKAAAAGHERVLRARLEDALFFFNEDKQHKLEKRLTALSGVIFQAQLGTMLEKTHRLEQLTAFICDIIAPQQKQTAIRAARLSKTDLVTDMVGEFPTLQGIMGKYYALNEGESQETAIAIAEHYMPLRAGSDLPQTISGAIVSLADRLDTIAGCFGIGKIPTGTTDPYGLRRHALALLHIISGLSFSLSLSECIDKAIDLYGDNLTQDKKTTGRAILDFVKGRYMNDLIARGVAQEAVEAVLSTSFDNIIDCRKRIDALISISSQETFTLLAGAFKRVINIIKDHQPSEIDVNLLQEEAEKRLYKIYGEVATEVNPLVHERRYEEALGKILLMKEPVDGFFDGVMVMTEDENLKNNRLSLLKAIAQLFLKIGDFSKMYTLKV